MQMLIDSADLDEMFAAERALIFKNSRHCSISAMARREIAELLDRRPDLPLYVVDVQAHAPLSREIERRTGIEHHSPQVIVLADGEPRWHASHFSITAQEVEHALEAV